MYLTRLQKIPEYQEYTKTKKLRDPLIFPNRRSEIYNKIAKKYSKSNNTIHKRLCLLSLPGDPIQNAIHLGELELQVAEETKK